MAADDRCAPSGEGGSRRQAAPAAALALALALGILACGLAGCGGLTPVQDPYNLAIAHYASGNYDAAISEYRDALEIEPADSLARFNLAATLERKAMEIEERARRRLPAAERSTAPPGGWPLDDAEKATVAALRGEALEHYRLIADDPSARPGPKLRARINLAASLSETGKTSEAETLLREIESERPEAPLAKVALASHLYRAKRFEEARTVLEQAVKLDPANADANTLLGDVLLRLGDAAGARKAYEAVLQRDPDSLAALTAVGRLAFAAGDFADAQAHYQRVLWIAPRDFEANLRMAQLLEASKDWTGAAFYYMQAERLDDGYHPQVEEVDYGEALERVVRSRREGPRSGGTPPAR